MLQTGALDAPVFSVGHMATVFLGHPQSMYRETRLGGKAVVEIGGTALKVRRGFFRQPSDRLTSRLDV